MTAVDYESPTVLAHGTWAPIPGNRLVRRWVANTPPPAHWHVACDFCGADVGQVCVARGVPRAPHARRLEAYRQQQAASGLSPTTGGTA